MILAISMIYYVARYVLLALQNAKSSKIQWNFSETSRGKYVNSVNIKLILDTPNVIFCM